MTSRFSRHATSVPHGTPRYSHGSDPRGRARQWCHRQAERPSHEPFRISASGEEALMSLSRTARRISLPALLAVVLAAVLLAIAPGRATPAGASAGAAAAGAGHPAKPVIVLEHGAWADASSWNRVISRLQRRGFTVYAPPNPLRGLPQDSDYLHQFLTQNPALHGQPVILVAHSYGGAVATAAAVGDPEVRALVYVDAFIPDAGDTVASLISGSCVAGTPTDLFNIVPIPGAPG